MTNIKTRIQNYEHSIDEHSNIRTCILLVICFIPYLSGRLLACSVARLFCIGCFLIIHYSLFIPLLAQQTKIDSLLSLIKKDKEDTNKVSHLNDLCWEYRSIGQYNSALHYGNAALDLGNKLFSQSTNQLINQPTIKKGIAHSYNNIGLVYWNQGNYPEALKNHFASLKIKEEIGGKKGIAGSYGNIGNIYWNQGDYPKALDYYFKALKMAEELGNKKEITHQLGNIGNVYGEKGDYPKALDYYFKALKLAEELRNKNRIAGLFINIGNVYKEQASALSRTEDREAKISDDYRRSDSLYKKALGYYFKALKLAEEIGNKNHIVIVLGNIGSFYTRVGEFIKAEKYLKQSLELADKIGSLDDIKEGNKNLSHLYDTTSRYKLAFEHYKKYIAAKDSITNEENTKKQTRIEMTYEFEKKEAKAKAEQEIKDAEAKAEAKKQQMVIWSVMAILLLVAVFTGFIARAYLQIKKKNKEIALQKQKIEEKQNEILASIRYAKRIQDALLPRESYIDKTLNRLKAKMP